MSKNIAFVLALGLLLAAGCAAAIPPTPTALPASVARPAQPAPVFAGSARDFTLGATPPSSPTLPPSPPQTPPAAPEAAAPHPAALLIEQTPSALGIVRSSAPLLAQPGGTLVETLPLGATVTVTGRSADGVWLAAYTAAGRPGWLAAADVTLFGGDDLITVQSAAGPGPIATLLAEAMLPPTSFDATPAP